eukprot:scaffold75362_cov19-Tisochrysis_lutea.AAC.3
MLMCGGIHSVVAEGNISLFHCISASKGYYHRKVKLQLEMWQEYDGKQGKSSTLFSERSSKLTTLTWLQ